MISVSYVIENAKIVRQGLEHLRKAIPEIGRKRLYDSAVDIRHRMKKKGRKPSYPIQWDTERQRKAFFASDGFGGGIPHKRTDEYTKAWKVVRTEDGYDVENPLSHAKFIAGTMTNEDRQSKIHRGRWNLFKRQAEIVIRKLPKLVKDHLVVVAREFGLNAK